MFSGAGRVLSEIASEICVVVNARRGFDPQDSQYLECSIRNERVRLRLLATLLHLAHAINLDQQIDPTLPPSLQKAPQTTRLRWWRQAYVRGVSISPSRLQLHIRLPKGREGEYRPILVEPLDQQIGLLLEKYDGILLIVGIDLKHVPADVTEADVPAIGDEEWPSVKQQIELAQAIQRKERLHQDIFDAQRLRELLVKAEIDKAEEMVNEGRHLEAAQLFAQVAGLLTKAQANAQARHYMGRAAKAYLEGGDRLSAAKEYLKAAEVWIEHGNSPESAEHELREVYKLATELTQPALQVRVRLAKAKIAFALLNRPATMERLKEANALLPQVNDKALRTDLSLRVARNHATFAMVWEKWEVAQGVLDAVLAACPEDAQEAQWQLLLAKLLLCAERGDWEGADKVYANAQQLTVANSSLKRGLLGLNYGASLARRGDLQKAYDTFQEAIQQLEADADLYTLGLAYRNMQHMLLRNGFLPWVKFDSYSMRRIDLFRHSQADNRGYLYKQQAEVNLSRQKYRQALQHIRLALAYYWNRSDWVAIENAYQILARIYAATNHLDWALLASIRAGDEKLAKQYSRSLCEEAEKEWLTEVIAFLVTPQITVYEQRVAVKALGILADVVPPRLLDQAIEHLLNLLSGPEENGKQREVRREAAMALGHLVPQFTPRQVGDVVRLVLDLFQQRPFWTVTRELLKLLSECFNPTRGQVEEEALYALVAETMLNFYDDHELISREIEKVLINLAPKAPTEVRKRVVAYFKEHTNPLDHVPYLTYLKESIPAEKLHAFTKQVLSAINQPPKIEEQDGERIFYMDFGRITPRALYEVRHILPLALHEAVIDGLLEAIINEDNQNWLRCHAIWMLSDLPKEIISKRVDEIVDYLLWGAEGTLPRSALIQELIDLRGNTDSIEEVRQSSLRALTGLYPHANHDHQAQIEKRLIAASRDTSSIVRQAVPIALNEIENSDALPVRLLLALVVLLHDPDPHTCGWACVASGNFITRGMASPFNDDLVERLLNLADTSPVVEVRVGTAIGLQLVAQSNSLDRETTQRCQDALAKLADDVSFRVRREATRPQQATNATDSATAIAT